MAARATPGDGVAAYQANPLEQRIDALLDEGYEHPARAMTALRALQAAHAEGPARPDILLAMGSVEAQAGHAAAAGALADQLLALGSTDPGGREVAASKLVRAQLAENAGQLDVAAALAQSALDTFQTGCPGLSKTVSAQATTCAYRPAWRALEILERRARSQGITVAANALADRAFALAQWAGDARRSALNLTTLAIYADERGEREQSRRLLGRAEHWAVAGDSLATRARVVGAEARLALAHEDRRGGMRLYDEALRQAVLARAPRLQSLLLNNLSDAYARLGRPADALRAAERALVIARAYGDGRLERLLVNNAGIAKIGLGRVAEGKRDLARLMQLWAQSGETGRQASTLLEFGQALADAGDARGALELYHRERALSAQLTLANRDMALKELKTRFDADAREHDIELLARDNALATAALANRDLALRIWGLLAFVMLLAIGLVAMLYRKVRDTRRRLEASHLQLRAQSDLDPLTQLANRRHLQAVMTQLCGKHGFSGALLLVDIDHFKQVNDSHGHAAGDQVLVDVARRLNETVRGEDLVVRWGGEEFLILAPKASAEQAEQLAARVLRVIGQAPIPLAETAHAASIRITASIGYARFPLPPSAAEVPWEQAVNLADMALYTAKNQGRNRSVGIVSTTASTLADLRDLEQDFDQARHDGRVTLLQRTGPPAPQRPAQPLASLRPMR